jgi:hypothetical protein
MSSMISLNCADGDGTRFETKTSWEYWIISR